VPDLSSASAGFVDWRVLNEFAVAHVPAERESA